MIMELTANNNESDWQDLKENEYGVFSTMSGNEIIGLVFLCRGCGKTVRISTKGKPSWNINFDTLTVTPSIRHDKDLGGCGWHGHLKSGKFEIG